MTDSSVAARDWPPPSNEDGVAPATPRPKRSRLVLGELMAMPPAAALWAVAMDRIFSVEYRPPPTPPADFPITTFFPETRGESWSALGQFLSLTFFGLAAAVVVTAAVAIAFGLARRVPRASRWIASALVGAWTMFAVYLCFALAAEMHRLTEQAGG